MTRWASARAFSSSASLALRLSARRWRRASSCGSRSAPAAVAPGEGVDVVGLLVAKAGAPHPRLVAAGGRQAPPSAGLSSCWRRLETDSHRRWGGGWACRSASRCWQKAQMDGLRCCRRAGSQRHLFRCSILGCVSVSPWELLPWRGDGTGHERGGADETYHGDPSSQHAEPDANAESCVWPRGEQIGSKESTTRREVGKKEKPHLRSSVACHWVEQPKVEHRKMGGSSRSRTSWSRLAASRAIEFGSQGHELDSFS